MHSAFLLSWSSSSLISNNELVLSITSHRYEILKEILNFFFPVTMVLWWLVEMDLLEFWVMEIGIVYQNLNLLNNYLGNDIFLQLLINFCNPTICVTCVSLKGTFLLHVTRWLPCLNFYWYSFNIHKLWIDAVLIQDFSYLVLMW